MTTAKQIVAKLIHEGHISVPERQALSDGRVERQMVADLLRDALEAHGRFPKHIGLSDAYSGRILEKTADGKYQMIWRAEVGLARYETAAIDQFTNMHEAVDAFIDHEWPDGIDGVPIVPARAR